MVREKIKEMLSDWLSLDQDSKEITNAMNEVFKKDEKLQKLLDEKKYVMKKIEERKEEIAQELINQKKRNDENIKLIKEDLSEDLETKKKIVSSIYRFYKVKFEKSEDELDEISTKYIQIFEEE
jgi:biopolymer transport protein ExbB/TolQ